MVICPVKLDTWIKKNSIRPSDLAGELKVTTMALWRYRRGRVPAPEIMRRVVKRTKGVVQPNDFYVGR